MIKVSFIIALIIYVYLCILVHFFCLNLTFSFVFKICLANQSLVSDLKPELNWWKRSLRHENIYLFLNAGEKSGHLLF